VAARLRLPISFFVETPPGIETQPDVHIDHAEAALAYSRLLRTQGKTDQALEYALWAAQALESRLDP
jgi:hypothetical protein